MKIPIKLIFIVCVYLLSFISAPAQNRVTITGQVVDKSTGEAIHLANVFLGNTSLGDATDKAGKFIIKNIPLGSYDLITSMIGYKVYKINIDIKDDQLVTINIKLLPQVYHGKEITISAEAPKEWQYNLAIFEKLFFGISEFSTKCKLLNPELIDFEYNKTSGRFKAFSEEPITFTNSALGYEIIFFIDKFEAILHQSNNSILKIHNRRYRKSRLINKGIRQFRELIPKNEKQKKKWHKNRLIAYKGSPRHFIQSLLNGRLKKEGFKITGTKTKIINGQEIFTSKSDYDIKSKDLIKQGELPNQYILFFPNHLKVTYKKERDTIKYQKIMLNLENRIGLYRNRDNIPVYAKEVPLKEWAQQDSWLKISNGDSLNISTNGFDLSNQEQLIYYGYWYWLSADEWLPLNYQIEMN